MGFFDSIMVSFRVQLAHLGIFMVCFCVQVAFGSARAHAHVRFFRFCLSGRIRAGLVA